MTEGHDDFRAAVNMTAGELEKWLETEESREVGQKMSEARNPWATTPAGQSSSCCTPERVN